VNLDIEKLSRFVEMDIEKKNLSAKLDRVKEEMAELEQELISDLIDCELDRVTLSSGRTVYMRTDTYARILSKEKAFDALRKSGFEDYIRDDVNTQQLSRLLRDFEEQEAEIPEEFIGIIEPYKKTSLRVVKS
jgi:hypothetical protein